MNTDSQWSKQEACLHVRLRCGSLSITAPVSLPVNEFNVQSVFHRLLSFAAVNQIYVFQIYVFHDSLKACFENINI